MARSYDPRVGELLALEAEVGRPLPYPATVIVQLEDSGYIVDIDTGDVLSSVTAQPTVFGEAIAHLLAAEVAL